MKVENLPKGHKIYAYNKEHSELKISHIIDLQYADPDTGQILRIPRPSNFIYERTADYGCGFVIKDGGNDAGFKLVAELGKYLHNDANYFTYRQG